VLDALSLRFGAAYLETSLCFQEATVDWWVIVIVIAAVFAAAFALHSPTIDAPSGGERPKHPDLEKPRD
jgi:hypothetical protein